MRRRKFLLIFFSTLVLLTAGTYVVLVYTGASRSFVESVMSRFIRRFSLRDAEVDPASGTVRLEGVQIGHPTLDEADVLVADQIELDVNTNPLDGTDIGTVRAVRIEKLNLHLSLTEGEQWDLVEILNLPDVATGEAGSYPAVIITDSKITVRITSDRPAVEFTDVHLELLPQAEGSDLMTLEGSMVSPSGFEVRIRGNGNLAQGELRAMFEASDLPLQPRAARPYSAEAEAYLADAGLTGMARNVALWIQYPPEPEDDNVVTARLSADVEGVSWTPSVFPYPVTQATGRITASTREGGRVYFDLLAGEGDMSIQTRGELTRCISGEPLVDARIEARSVQVTEELRHAVRALPYARVAWDAFDPHNGTANADLFLHNEEPGAPPILSMDLEFDGVSAQFLGFPTDLSERKVSFPYLLQDAQGTVQIREDKVAIQDVTGRRPEGGKVLINGMVALSGPTIDEIQIDIEAESAVFSDDLRRAVDTLLEGGGAVYDSYAPRGISDAEVRIRHTAGQEPQFYVELNPRDASASYHLFPYRLEGLTGNIRIANDGVAFELSGARNRATADLGGRFLFAPTPEAMQSELWLRAESAALDADLRRALYVVNPDLDLFWHEFLPTGTVDCNLAMWTPPGEDEFQHDLRLDFKRGSALVRKFDRRLTSMRGSVFVHGSGPDNRLDVSILRGEVANGDQTEAQVVLEGTLETKAEANQVDLTTIIRDLRLNSRLAATMDNAEILSLQTWDVLAPSGLVDVAARHRKSFGQAEILHEARVQLRDVRSDAAVLPRSVTNLRGEVFVTGGTGIFDSIRGQLGTSPLSFEEGFFEHRPGESVVEVKVSAEELPVDSDFANLMTGPMRETFEQRNVRGNLDIRQLEMSYTFPDDGDNFDLTFSGPVDAKNLNLTLVAPIQELNGTFRFEDGRITADGGRVRCTAEQARFSIAGHQATGFQGVLTATPEEIALEAMSVDIHGGVVRASGEGERALTFDLENDSLDVDIAWEEVSLASFVRSAGQATPFTRGTMEGNLSLELPIGRGVDIVADAALQIRNGRLGEVPMFTAIYAFLPPNKRPQFDGARLEVAVRDHQMQIEDLVMTSPLVEVRGQGTVGLDGYLDIVLEFPDLFASGDWLVLPQVLKAITSQVVRFHLYGYMRSPSARPRWLFQTTPGRREIVPIPAWTRERAKRRF